MTPKAKTIEDFDLANMIRQAEFCKNLGMPFSQFREYRRKAGISEQQLDKVEAVLFGVVAQGDEI